MAYITAISNIVKLIGVIDGINQSFTTPTNYIPGSLRLIWNGQVVESDDELQGWSETGENAVATTIAPQTGDILQAFYQESTGVEGVIGSPFHPQNVYP